MKFLTDLFKTNKQFKIEQQSILQKVEENCSRLMKVADGLPEGEQKTKLIDETTKLHQTLKTFQAELA